MQLHQMFIEIAKSNAKKIGVYDIATGKDITYERMLIAALILAKKFSGYKGKYLGIMVPTSAGCMLSILGTLMCGKIPVMINYSTGARENCFYAQETCSFKTIITSKKLLEKINIKTVDGMIFLEDIMASLSLFDKLPALIKSKLSAKKIISAVHKGPESEVSVILFTSGSEKEPKAVQLSHKNILHNINNIPKIVDLRPDDIYLANLPLFHIFGLTIDFWLPLSFGGTMVAYPNPLDYKIICRIVKKYQVSIMAGTPAFYYGYLKKSEPGDFASLRLAVAGADKLTPHIYEGFVKKHNVRIMEGYGTTETSPVISVNSERYSKVGSVGKPLPGVQVKIIDIETSEELPRNEEGKVIVKGDLVMEGYLGDIEETSLRIRNGWYDTGDMGVMDEEGYLWHRGRLKRFVKVGGEMVSLVRVEGVMEKLLPDDSVCCVVDVPNPTKGADIVAAIATTEIDRRKILKEMAKQLPSIAVPKDIYFIENIPMMGSGKVNFREVEQICRDMQSNGTKELKSEEIKKLKK
ncbi:MAG: AMP-binding protein [Candidatus Cloacimonetes bacterium]|nr:AMP-binding protein [Candidatus Cloacimonadota bacterium]